MLVPPQWRIAFFTASFPPALRYPLKGVVSRRAASWNSFSAASCGCSGRWMRKKACSRMPDGDRGGRDVCMSTVSEGWSPLLWECDVLFSPPALRLPDLLSGASLLPVRRGVTRTLLQIHCFNQKQLLIFWKDGFSRGKLMPCKKYFWEAYIVDSQPADNIVSRCNAFFSKLNCYFFAFQWIIRSLK